MSTKAKNKKLNILMIVLICIVVGCGIMAVGNIKGWFGGNSESEIVSTSIVGVANMERSNIAYTLDEDVPMKAGDIAETKTDSEAEFAINGGGALARKANTMTLGSNSEMRISRCAEDDIELALKKGEFFAKITKAPDNCIVNFDDCTGILEDSIFSLSVQKGSAELNVYQGKLTIEMANNSDGKTAEKIEVEAGQKLVLTNKGDGKISAETAELKAESLSEFQITKLQSINEDTCFSISKLEKVVKDREKEKKAAQKALEKEAIAVAEGENGSGKNGTEESNAKVMTCTIQIQCKSILSNMSKLKAGKDRYVPANGVILATSKVEFNEGDTAYDVTKRACSACGVQIEAAYTPAYGSYYIEGMNHLYEFDCGDMSGWIFKVNGWVPNYGSSEYKLKNGDSILWYYTCTGK